jgi:hypothetical protein
MRAPIGQPCRNGVPLDDYVINRELTIGKGAAEVCDLLFVALEIFDIGIGRSMADKVDGVKFIQCAPVALVQCLNDPMDNSLELFCWHEIAS